MIRLALLAHHYRSDWEWSDADLVTATDRAARLRAAGLSTPAGAELLGAVRERLAGDLDAPGALALLDAWAARAGGGPAPSAEPAAQGVTVGALLDTLLGVDLS